MIRALVTGASRGIGEAIAYRLAADGMEVLVNGMSNTGAADAVVEKIHQAGGKAKSIIFDVTDKEAATRILEEELELGVIQVVVSNAGITDDMLMAAMSHDQWQRVIDVSLNGFFNVTQPLILPMLSSRWGRVIAISSVTGMMGNAGQVNYAAAKSGLHGACKALAKEVGVRNITANVVAPGIIETAMIDGVFSPEQIKTLVPMRRAGKPEEVADLVGFLSSKQAEYISGQVIAVSGGLV